MWRNATVRDAVHRDAIVRSCYAKHATIFRVMPHCVTHDRVMAHVNQAPHVVSTALMAGAGAPQGRDDSSWQGVLDTNADFIADALVAIASKLPTSSSALTDTPAVRDIFERAKRLKSPL